MKSLIFNRKSGEWASPFLFRPLGAVGVSPPEPLHGDFYQIFLLKIWHFNKEACHPLGDNL